MSRPRLPDRPLVAFAASRAVLVIFAGIALTTFPMALQQGEWQAFPGNPLLDGWARFDSGWYWSIIDHGYYYEPGEPSNVNFFPLFSLLAWGVATPFRALFEPHQAFYLGGILVSHASFAAALVGMHRIAERRFDRASASRGVWLLALYPFSFFFAAAYSEALFLALAVWAFERAERDQWLMACALAAPCAVTRVVGFAVALGLGVMYLERRRPILRGWPFVIPPLALAALLAYFWWSFGDPLVFATTQTEVWGRSIGFHHLWEAGEIVANDGAPWDLRFLLGWYLFLVVATVPLLYVVARRLGLGYAAFVAVPFALAVMSGTAGLGRYVAVLFPLFLVTGALLSWRTFALLVALFVPSLLLFSYWFTNWHLVT